MLGPDGVGVLGPDGVGVLGPDGVGVLGPDGVGVLGPDGVGAAGAAVPALVPLPWARTWKATEKTVTVITHINRFIRFMINQSFLE